MSQPSFESVSDDALGAVPTVLRKQSQWNAYLALLAISAAALMTAVLFLGLEWALEYGMESTAPRV